MTDHTTPTSASSPPPVDAQAVKALASELDFALCAITPAKASDYPQQLRDWLDAKKHGSMDWLANHTDTRLDPSQLLPGAQSIITLADYIGPPPPPESPESPELPPRKDASVHDSMSEQGEVVSDESSGARGRIARYAHHNDYHKIIKKRLHAFVDQIAPRVPGHTFKACVDTAPILEREHAMRAGLGWVGKHTLLIHPKLGSHILLAEILTTLPLESDVPQTDHCAECTACIDACPTDCITPYSVDATRCISYLTIEHREEIDPALHEAMGDWIFGCDICQDACPHNGKRHEAVTPGAYLRSNAEVEAVLDLGAILDWDEEDRRAAFVKSSMKRAKLGPIKRNALIAAGNYLKSHVDKSLESKVAQLSENPDEQALVRQTAKSILENQDK